MLAHLSWVLFRSDHPTVAFEQQEVVRWLFLRSVGPVQLLTEQAPPVGRTGYWCGELAVGGVCQPQALGCNYSHWWTADYISANVTPRTAIAGARGATV